MNERPYNPDTHAHSEQLFFKVCPNCGLELNYYRERGHQHWRWRGNATKGLFEKKGVVYVKCICGGYIPTRLKPMVKG